MKLHSALKLKNRLAGELNRLVTILQRENSRRNDNLSKIDCAEVEKNIVETREKLISVKSAICVANIGIYPTLARMEELKSYITQLNNLNCREGEEVHVTYAKENLTYNWTCYINQEKKDILVQKYQLEIDALQDKVDEYNAGTDVNI